MGIGKSRGTSPINVNDMLEKVEMNQQIESEKQEIDKLLVEIREAKETLIKFNEDLEKAIAAECHIEGALKAAVGSCDNIVNGICNAIVKAERDTKFKTTITESVERKSYRQRKFRMRDMDTDDSSDCGRQCA